MRVETAQIKTKPTQHMSQGINRTELEEIIVKQATSNPKYRELLLQNPRELVERQIGESLPANVQVKVIQESANEVYIRLPYNVAEGAELADEDLEQVAGGKGNQDKVYCTGAASAGGFNSKNEIRVGG